MIRRDGLDGERTLAVVTHVHPDHSLGAEVFREAGARILGHARLGAALSARIGSYTTTYRDTIGAAAFHPGLAAFLFGFGAGAIVQVIVQLTPSLRDEAGRTLHPVAVGGLLAGMALMFATGLLVSV